MQIYHFPVPYPDFIGHIAVAMTLLYRKHRRGFAYRKIKLTKGKHALIDPEDYDRIAAYDWQAIEGRCGNFYAGRIEGGKIIYMHRQIMNNPEGLIVDHKYRNGLNNTKANLRIVTQAQNACNSGKTSSICSSKYKGVNFSKDKNKWRAYITYKTKRRHLGYFETELEAARAYDAAAKKLHGKFACLNFDNRRENGNRPVKSVFRSILGVIIDISVGSVTKKIAS
jgi:hypothetical protein